MNRTNQVLGWFFRGLTLAAMLLVQYTLGSWSTGFRAIVTCPVGIVLTSYPGFNLFPFFLIIRFGRGDVLFHRLNILPKSTRSECTQHLSLAKDIKKTNNFTSPFFIGFFA